MKVELGVPDFIVKIIGAFVGKNAAHLGRKLTTYLGSLILASVVFQGGVVDPSIEIDPSVAVPSIGQIEDGITVGEALKVGFGMILIWTSRVMSFLRAQKLDWASNFLGALIGRNLQSLFRSALTVLSGFLTWVGVAGVEVTGIAGEPLYAIVGAVIGILASGASSYFIDSKVNPNRKVGGFSYLFDKKDKKDEQTTIL